MRKAGMILNAMLALAAVLLAGCADTDASTTPEAPVISVTGTNAKTVTITCATTGAVIHYTTDGGTPAADSSEYTAAFTVAGEGVTKTIQAIAVLSDACSEVSAQTVSISHSALSLSRDVTTFAGKAGSTGTTDGTGTDALFNVPYGITTDGTTLYVTDTSNHTIRAVNISTGAVTTFAGNAGTYGSLDGTGTNATFSYPIGITTDGVSLYVTDTQNCTIRVIDIATAAVTTLAGNAGVTGSANGTGTAATFYYPYGITTDGASLYVADSYNHLIRKIDIATAAVTTLAGTVSTTGNTDGVGTAAAFYNPSALSTDGTYLYVADNGNKRIRMIDIASAEVTTLVRDDGAYCMPWAFTAVDGTSLYATTGDENCLYQFLLSSGVGAVLAGSSTSGTTDANGTDARFSMPLGLVSDGSALYVVDSSNNTIRVIR